MEEEDQIGIEDTLNNIYSELSRFENQRVK
jgi:hypothetical protein